MRSEINTFGAHLLRQELAIAFRGPILKSYGNLVNVLSPWMNSIGAEGSAEDQDFGTVFEYLQLLREQHYTIVLFDGAIIQLAYVFFRGELIKHRLCYYPCPVNVDFRNEEYESFVDFIEEAIVRDPLSLLRLRSPMRFAF